MRLSEQTELTTSVSGVSATVQMSVNLDGRMLRNLVSGMYSRKAEAVLRELVANGIDAHAMTRNTTDNVVVRLPTALQDDFVIRDYGPGMPHDFVLNNYSTLGFSSKTRTNAATGMFGLGSKTPYAVVDRFSVVTYIAGEERSYLCHYDDEGMPSVSFIGTRKTDDRDGTRVSFKTPRAMHEEFREALRRISVSFVDYKVHVENGGDWRTQTTLFIPGVYVYENNSGVREWLTVRQGAAIYPLNGDLLPSIMVPNITQPVSSPLQAHSNANKMSALQILKQYKHRNNGSQYGMMIDIPIGSVDVTTSREEMEYTPKTVKALSDKLTEIAVALRKEEARLIGDAKDSKGIVENVSKHILGKPYDYSQKSYDSISYLANILTSNLVERSPVSITRYDDSKHSKLFAGSFSLYGLPSGAFAEIIRTSAVPIFSGATNWRFNNYSQGHFATIDALRPIVLMKLASHSVKGNELLRAQQYVHEADQGLLVRYIVVVDKEWDRVEKYAKYLGTWVHSVVDVSTITLNHEKYGPTVKKTPTERTRRADNEFDVLSVEEDNPSQYAELNIIVDYTEDIYYVSRVPDLRNQVYLHADKGQAVNFSDTRTNLELNIPQQVPASVLQTALRHHPQRRTHKFVILNHSQCVPAILNKFKSAKPMSEAFKVLFEEHVRAQAEALRYATVFRRQSLCISTTTEVILEFVNRGEDLLRGRHPIIWNTVRDVLSTISNNPSLRKLTATAMTHRAIAGGHTLGKDPLTRAYLNGDLLPPYNVRNFLKPHYNPASVSQDETLFHKWVDATFPVGIGSANLQYADRNGIVQYTRAIEYFIWSIMKYHNDADLKDNLRLIDDALLSGAYDKLDKLVASLKIGPVVNQKAQKTVAAA